MMPPVPSTQFDLHRLAAHAAHLPPTARVLGRLLTAISDSNTSLQFVAGLVRLDPVIASLMLRVSNSVAFGFNVPATSVDEAVLRIGMREVQRIAALASAAHVFPADLHLYGTTADALWENAVVTAIAMESLAARAGQDPSLAYTAGLMRSVGKMVLARHAAGHPGVTALAESGKPLPEWERSYFGMTYADVGAGLCDLWKFPREIGLGIRDHLGQPERVSMLGRLLNVAGGIAAELGYAGPGEDGLWLTAPLREAVTGVAEERLAEIAARTHHIFHSMQETLALIRG